MNTTEQQLLKLIKQGENLTLEFKECKNGINRAVYETVCSFLNRHGGTLLLGVDDSGQVVGINSDAITQIRKDFITAINNPQKINPACYLSIDEYQAHGKLILHIYVPGSSQVHRCNGRIFDRNEDGDLNITDHTRLVSDLYHRKQASYSENKIYPYATLDDLNPDLLILIRKIVSNQRKNHIWITLDDLESRLESGLAARILIAIKVTPLGRSQIAKSLGHQSVSSGLHKQIRRLVELGLIEMTLPSSPKSRLQKYRLTNKAHEIINET